MGKRICFSFLMFLLSFFVCHSYVSAENDRIVHPVLSSDCFESEFQKTAGSTARMLVAENTDDLSETLGSDNDELDDELMQDFEDSSETQSVADPLYYFNYAMYSFNDFLYFAAIKPLSQGYKAVTPVIVRKGVSNFFHNLLFPVRFVSNLLQGRVVNAGREVEIFVINSTIGFLGFAKIAQNQFDLHTSDEDLGQTLGSYSIGNGFYLVLPVLGPSTLRDAIGRVGDYFLNPVTYVEPWEVSTGIKAYDSINTTSFHIGDYEAIKKASIDPYQAIKNAYIQHRARKVENKE